MKMVMMSEVDCAQVKAILLTHAEMQDRRINEIMEIQSRLKLEEPEDGAELILDMDDQVVTFEEDCDNLKRIAQIF